MQMPNLSLVSPPPAGFGTEEQDQSCDVIVEEPMSSLGSLPSQPQGFGSIPPQSPSADFHFQPYDASIFASENAFRHERYREEVMKNCRKAAERKKFWYSRRHKVNSPVYEVARRPRDSENT